jgi:hypothetical protein
MTPLDSHINTIIQTRGAKKKVDLDKENDKKGAKKRDAISAGLSDLSSGRMTRARAK